LKSQIPSAYVTDDVNNDLTGDEYINNGHENDRSTDNKQIK